MFAAPATPANEVLSLASLSALLLDPLTLVATQAGILRQARRQVECIGHGHTMSFAP